jgi:Xaa-Pro aminopeptidase
MKREIVLKGSCQSNADMLYFTGVPVPDPFYAFTLRGKNCALIGALEFDRLSKGGALDEIFDLTSLSRKFFPDRRADDTAVLSKILKKGRVRGLLVPSDFPALELEKLRREGFDVAVSESPIFPQRDVKSARELKEIEKANSVAAKGFARIAEILRESKIVGRKLMFGGRILTGEFLRYEVERTALSMGADAMYTIVASGNQACNPHEVGRGAVAPNSLIVADIFPRLRDSGYFGDMTRTFLKGEPNSAQIKLVETVAAAQKLALSKIRAGVDGADIHAAVDDFFEDCGYFTECKNGVWRGFFHSVGHGVGLDIHEKISISPRRCILKAGNVVTVEPGLYYYGVGGCRIEDTVVVTEKGAKKLSAYPYDWVIK